MAQRAAKGKAAGTGKNCHDFVGVPGQIAGMRQVEGDMRGPEAREYRDIAAVVIGRNEGARLRACLASLGGVARVVYVDSGSTDGSPDMARAAGAEVVALDTAHPFTAARARNAGLAALETGAVPDFVQVIDGDCRLRAGWLDTARAFLRSAPEAAIACGRRREEDPDASVYNRLIDREWNTPTGRARACGGDALLRLGAVRDAGGYRAGLIAGEEPELCVRLRALGWQIWRLDAEMTWHDAGMTRFGQWWRRCRRTGHAYAEGAALHGAPPERHWRAETRRALIWGGGLPLAALAGAALHPAALLLLAAYPAQVVRLALREGPARRESWAYAAFTVLGKFPEALGVLGFHLARLRGRKPGLIEYK